MSNMTNQLYSLAGDARQADASPDNIKLQAKAAASLQAMIRHFDRKLPRIEAAKAALKLNQIMDAATQRGGEGRVASLIAELNDLG